MKFGIKKSNSTHVFRSVVPQSLGTDNGSFLQTGYRSRRSYKGWACKGPPASSPLIGRQHETFNYHHMMKTFLIKPVTVCF